MITDYELNLSKDQAITATAASTNYIDLKSSKDVAVGDPVKVACRISEAFNTLTSLKVAIEADDDSAFGTAVELCSTTPLLAALTLNAVVKVPSIPTGTSRRYLRAKYTVGGSNPSTGKVTLSLVPGVDVKPANTGVTL